MVISSSSTVESGSVAEVDNHVSLAPSTLTPASPDEGAEYPNKLAGLLWWLLLLLEMKASPKFKDSIALPSSARIDAVGMVMGSFDMIMIKGGMR